MNDKFEVTFLGTCGSCAYNGGDRVKYGSNTLCVAVRAGEETLIFDSGTGICGFNNLADYQRDRISMFFSHYHIDHFSGLLFFSQLFDPQKSFEIYGAGNGKQDFRDVVDSFLSHPLHPVGLESLSASIRFHMIGTGDEVSLPNGVKVRVHGLSHPGGTLGYRVEYDGKAFCYCTDVALAEHQNDDALLAFTGGADLLVLDSFFEDGMVMPGWGHSSWRECAEWARLAQVKRLALFHYGFKFCDREIFNMEEKAKKIFPDTFAAADRLKIEL